MRGLPDGATPPAVLINAFAETLEQGNGAAGGTARQTGLSSLDAVGGLLFKQSETAFLLPMAALEIPWPGPGPCPKP